MKILIAIVLSIFAVVVIYILFTGLTLPQNKEVDNASLSQTPINGSVVSNAKVFTLSDVASHNSISSCWTIIHGKVYDITSLISTHSGGSESVLRDCGKDGSVGFDTKYKNSSHSSGAKAILDSYYIGDLKN